MKWDDVKGDTKSKCDFCGEGNDQLSRVAGDPEGRKRACGKCLRKLLYEQGVLSSPEKPEGAKW